MCIKEIRGIKRSSREYKYLNFMIKFNKSQSTAQKVLKNFKNSKALTLSYI